MPRFSLRETPMYRLYSGRGEDETGRRAILADGVLRSTISSLGTGAFFTGFFMLYGVDIVNISILTFVPYLTSAAAVFAPLLLERVRQRKPMLLAGRALHYLLYLLVLTLLPMLLGDSPLMIPLCVAVIFLANVIGNGCQSGYDAWFLDFLPEHIRARHFSYMTLWQSFVGLGLALLTGVVIDAFSGTRTEQAIFLGVRFLIVALGALDVWICARPVERSRVQGASSLRLGEVFSIPMRNAKYMGVVLIIAAYTVANNLYASTINYYLLDDCGISYTYINFMNMTYPFALLFLQPMWRRALQRTSWMWVYGVSILIYAVSNLMYGFVDGSNYLVLLTVIRLVQHVSGAGSSMSGANLVYLSTPQANRTSYISFYNVLLNLATFISMMLGTAVVRVMGPGRVELAGMSFGSVQALLFVSGIASLAVGVVLFCNLRRLSPEEAP